MLGCRSTKSLTVPADTSITSIARTMAMIMTDDLRSPSRPR